MTGLVSRIWGFYPVFTHKHHTYVSYLACGLTRCACQTAVYTKFQKVREKLPRKKVRTSQTKELII